jgi:hypothetical protein
MRALVVFESMFGNTRQIAGAVADGLSEAVRTDLVEVSRVPVQIPGDVELVVVGGRTHAFGMTRPGTRQDAARQAAGPLASAGTGISEWLEQLTRAPAGSARRPSTPRSRSRCCRARPPRHPQRRLRRCGFAVLEPARTFWVRGTQAPLCGGEEERARQWGARLASALTARQPPR